MPLLEMPAGTTPTSLEDGADDEGWFDPDHLLDVEIEIEEDDWDDLRTQTQTIFTLLKGDCMAEPFPSPFTYFEADVTVDGERLETIGVRKKGLIGSLSQDKPSLKIKSDKFVEDQFFANGTERITINNQRQDPSLIHACMAYQVFADAGLPAPRCNFASAKLNGEPLGVFAHVEAMKSHDVVINSHAEPIQY